LGNEKSVVRETIYNIFCFVENGTISEAALCTHDGDGSDEEKSDQLRAAVVSDLSEATRVRLPKAVTHDSFVAMQRLGRHLDLFEPLFKSLGAPKDPFCCVTAVVGGHPRIDIRTNHAPLTAQLMQSLDTPTLHDVEDWLTKYATEDGFDLPRLLNDDYFCAIRLLYNAKQYVSCTKLLVSFIDTASFLAYGDEPSVFTRWLDTHANIGCLGITPQELWELRNSLLHMSNLDSRKVLNNRVRRISFCIAPRGCCASPDAEITYFNLLDLIEQVANGVSHWITYINANRAEFVDFVARYDRILSDDRRTYVAMPQPPAAADADKPRG
jgi:hypothetical protein